MVEFVSLFLGLVVGQIEVEVTADATVAAVVLELDGKRFGELSAPEWQLTVDLGEELRPRRLEAVAFDQRGVEIDRSIRLLNVYRPPAGVDFVLHRNSAGWVTMIGLSWASRSGATARRSAVAVDGLPVDFEDPSSIWLPPLDPAELHVIEVVVEYTDGVVASDHLGVGGPVLGTSSARLTPVVVEARSPDRSQPPATTARRVSSGERVRVLGAERGEAELAFVRDGAAARAVERIGPTRATMGMLGGGRDAALGRVIRAVPLLEHERARILDPEASPHPGPDLDPRAVPMPLLRDRASGFGLFWHLKQRDPELTSGHQAWIADALAVAAGRVATGGRRRAAILVLAPESADEGSRLSPSSVVRYLESLRVPLHVWYVGKPPKAPGPWGPAVAVRSLPGMQQALDDLRATVDRQWIVWVEGVHLPGEIEIELAAQSRATTAEGARFTG